MNIIEKHVRSLDLLMQNPIIVKKLSENFKDVEDITVPTLASIVENKSLFLKFILSDFDKYHRLEKALDKVRGDQLLIYFSDLKLYAIVDSMEKVKEFRSGVSDDDSGLQHIYLTQVVLNYQKQLLAFKCSSEKHLNEVVNFTEKYFDCKVFVSRGDCISVSTNVIVDSDAKSRAAFNKMHTEMCHDNIIAADSIYQSGVLKAHGSHFTTRVLSEQELLFVDDTKYLDNNRKPKAKRSNGEAAVYEYLVERDIKFEEQYRFAGCVHKKPLPFDFYLLDYNVCIEYDGIQHSEPVEYFGGKDAFEAQKIKDCIKNDYCNNNDIGLLRIPHTVTGSANIKTVLDDYLRKFPLAIAVASDNDLLGDEILIVNTTAEKINDVCNWITANPPGNSEITTEYYNRYVAATPYPIEKNQFEKYFIKIDLYLPY